MAKKYHSVRGKCALPLPLRPTFKQNEKLKEGVKFFEYWQNLSPELAELARVRVYRMKPPIDLTKIGSKVKSIQIWEGPIPFKAEDYENEFYNASWAGGGDYRCAIEEIGVSGVVCEVFFSLPDWDTYPPKVADAALMLESNGGKEYEQWRARRGDPVAKPDSDKPKESEDEFSMGMGAAATPAAVLVSGMVDVMKEQVKHAKDEAQEAKQAAREALQNPEPATDIMMQSASESIKLIADTSREMMKNSNAPDPVEMVKAIVGLLPAPAPPPDNAPMFNAMLGIVQESNKAVLQMVLAQNTELKNEIVKLRDTPSTAVAVNTDGIAELEKFQKMANLLGWSRGDGAPSEPKKTVMEEWGPIIQMGMQILGPLAGALVQKLTTPAAVSNPIPPPGMPTPQPQPAPAPQPAPPDSPQAQMLQFMQRIEGPFLSHLLSPDFDGFTFALHILTDGHGGSIETVAGRAQYNQMKQMLVKQPNGDVPLDRLIRSYAPIWERAKGDLPSYQKFLTEFANYDEQVGEPLPSSKPS